MVRKRLTSVFGPDSQITDDEWQGLWTIINYNHGLSIGHKLIRYMQERKINRERWVGALVLTTLPVRLIDGMLDPISGAHMVKRYKEIMPAAASDVACLEHVGHYPQIEDPQAVLDAFLAFTVAQHE